MRSHTEARFWKFYDRLPEDVQRLADGAYKLWQSNPYHPSLQFKCVDPRDPIYSVRVGRGYRALGWLEGGTVTWFWIGDHDEYMRLLKQM
ncbi:MAG: hypothetical protein H8E47_01215 [Anaerolineales bacterium]|nr:hypothetical protein [Anaerolineales bacterium]